MAVPPEEAYDHWLLRTRPAIEAQAKINQKAACNRLHNLWKAHGCSNAVFKKIAGRNTKNPRLSDPIQDICSEIGDLLKQYNCT